MTNFPKINHIHYTSLRLQYVCVCVCLCNSLCAVLFQQGPKEKAEFFVFCLAVIQEREINSSMSNAYCTAFFLRHDLCCPLSRKACVVAFLCSLYCVVTGSVLLCKAELLCLYALIFVYG